MESALNTANSEISAKLFEVTSIFTHPLYHALNYPSYGMHPAMMVHPMAGVGASLYMNSLY